MNNSNTGYMVIPMDLTERQALIYMQMYKRCNFQDMTVKYTTSQLKCDIRIIDIDRNAIDRDIKKMVEKGYLKVLIQGRRGNPTTYEIVKKRELSENNMRTKRELKHSNNEGLSYDSENNMRTKRELSENPIKEKEKENNIYSENILKAIAKYPGKKVKSVRDRKLPKLIKKYGEEQIIKCIDRYFNECKSKDKQFILQESTFWNGRYEDYLDENYLDKQEPTKIIRREEMKMTFRDL
ncbi:MAG: hypothetical protein ACLRRH_04540 [Clostridium sp.]